MIRAPAGRAILRALLLCCCTALQCAAVHGQEERALAVGSKTFSESHILAEIAAQLLEARGYRVERRLGLGGTLIAYEALKRGELDIYPEYTGTLVRAVLRQTELSREGLDNRLESEGLRLFPSLGFNNSYAIAVDEELAEDLSLRSVSDLAPHTALRLGFSHEFLNRGDGWPALQRRYGLGQQPTSIEHALAYRAIDQGHLDATDAYTTDGDLDFYSLRLLRDDRGLFPAYDAGLLLRADLPPEVVEVLGRLENRIDEARMRRLNRRVASDGETPAAVARGFLLAESLIDGNTAEGADDARVRRRLLRNTLTHLKLTALALLLGCLVAIPTALLFSRSARTSAALQYTAGLVQTVPALALLALLIPLLGLGQLTAVAALFLYSLLPIVRNTLAGLAAVDPLLKEVAASLGLSPAQQMMKIELPLAAPMILAGIKTAAIISIGTATLAAFVGAGGLGEPIITGLTLNDHALILQGAVPAAGLAIAVEFIFELVEKRFIPAHLRVR